MFPNKSQYANLELPQKIGTMMHVTLLCRSRNKIIYFRASVKRIHDVK